jgi:hypothetical protein
LLLAVPGLLLSFAARLDAAKSLVAIVSGGRQATGRWCCCCMGGGSYYFAPLVVAYAVGLLMANVAVYVMNMGQPALLYLVPCTLGTMSVLGWRRQELRALWEGPRVLAAADQIVYGRPVVSSQNNSTNAAAMSSSTSQADRQHQQVDDDEQQQEDQLFDDEAGDVPLLPTTNSSSSGNNTPSD